ncbi:hypothetical protein BKA70DRAFT_1263844 [Coprinopsis sp. MPI-PUGE-AT-0042]|nr:hypothetical protein BKA70DRAFT_1263844 [Coprinopsis sp. MPI-PUGE-AT-0042]
MDKKKAIASQRGNHSKYLGIPDERHWPAVVDIPEYQNMKRLDQSTNRLTDWC